MKLDSPESPPPPNFGLLINCERSSPNSFCLFGPLEELLMITPPPFKSLRLNSSVGL